MSNGNTPSKVAAWKQYQQQQKQSTFLVDLSTAVDLTVSPCAKRASFPYSILPPLRHVDFDTLLNDVLRLPSVRATAIGGVMWGAGAVSAYHWLQRRGASLALRGILGLVVVIMVLRWITGRMPPKQNLSTSINVSSNLAGVCNVTGPVVTLSNSHAGTHADTPSHFLQHNHGSSPASPSPPASPTAATAAASSSSSSSLADFDPCCYVGDAVILDLSRSLAARNTREIDDAVLDDVVTPLREHLKRINQGEMTMNIWRIILCTKRCDSEDLDARDQWTDNFAHLSRSGATHLARCFPNLLLLATDSPSVDRVDANPIKDFAHGELYRHRIAIVENVDCRPFYARLQQAAVAEEPGTIFGSVQCVFNDAQKFKDARGCNIFFYPLQK